MDHVLKFRKRRIERLEKRFGEYHGPARFDADDDAEESSNRVAQRGSGHGNTKIPFGLCQREGIKIGQDWTPKDAWDALAGKGYTASDVYRELRTTGKVAPRAPKEPEKPKLDKKQIDDSVKAYKDKKKEIKKLEKEYQKVEKEADEARLENNLESNKLNRIMDQIDRFEKEHDMDKIESWEERERVLAERTELYNKLKAQTKLANDSYNRKEELKKKVQDVNNQINEAKKSSKELGEKCFEAIESSPIYKNVIDYRGLEEEASGDIKLYKEYEEKAAFWSNAHKEAEERYERIVRERGEDSTPAKMAKYDIEPYGRYARDYAAKADALRPKAEEYEKRIREARGETSDKEWKQIYDLSVERDTVQDGPYDKLSDYAHTFKLNLKYLNPRKYIKTPSEETIINKISGGDETRGSCASLAFAYLANKSGYNVTDFRGGKSQGFFARKCTSMVRDLGGFYERSTNDIEVSKRALGQVEEGKEYWFATGRHASVVKKVNGQLKYLELQSWSENGWKDLNDDVIKDRFKGKSRYRGSKYSTTAIIETSKLFESSEMVSIMGYINTPEDKQKKGASGGIK